MQKVVQQETAYSTVVVNDHIYVSPSLPISCFYRRYDIRGNAYPDRKRVVCIPRFYSRKTIQYPGIPVKEKKIPPFVHLLAA